MQDTFILYSYFRSSASHRVRIALHLKNIKYEYRAVHLLKNGGEQRRSEYLKLNPQGQVPCLVHNGQSLAQSLAIIQYLDEIQPEPKLLPTHPLEKARIVQFCEVFNSGIQPLQNLMVLNHLEKQFGASHEQKKDWVVHWNQHYLSSAEKMIKDHSGKFCFGDSPSAADCYLIAHLQSTRRYEIDLGLYPVMQRIFQHASQMPAFVKAAPENQPDYEVIT